MPAAAVDVEFGYRDPDTDEICEPNAKQRLAHDTDADWIFYGGAAGGGKSEWLVVSAIKDCLQWSKSNVAIFRRTYGELEEHIIPRLLELIAPLERAKLVRFRSSKPARAIFWNGSILWLCACLHEKDVYKYQSFQLRSLNVDEASHFTEFQIKYLITRVRKASVKGRKRVRLGSNPGNVGHGWLKRWFVRPQPESLGDRPALGDYEVWRPRPDNPRIPPHKVATRVFIPARFEDNEALQKADPDYLETNVYPLGGDKARQLAEGDWDASESMVVGDLWRESHLVTEEDVELRVFGVPAGQIISWNVLKDPTWRPPSHATIYGSVDYGYGAPWSFHLTSVLPGGHTRTFWERYKTKLRDEKQAEMIRDDILRLKDECGLQTPDWIVCDPAMWNSRAEMRMKSIAEIYASILNPIGVRLLQGAAGRGARLSRPQRWKAALDVAPDGLPWWSCTTACPNLIRTVPEVPWDEEDPEVEDDRSENHCYEDMGRFFEARPHVPAAPKVDEYKHLDPMSRRYWQAEDAKQAKRQPKRGVTAGALNILR